MCPITVKPTKMNKKKENIPNLRLQPQGLRPSVALVRTMAIRVEGVK
jgi:hypothetical protein